MIAVAATAAVTAIADAIESYVIGIRLEEYCSNHLQKGIKIYVVPQRHRVPNYTNLQNNLA